MFAGSSSQDGSFPLQVGASINGRLTMMPAPITSLTDHAVQGSSRFIGSIESDRYEIISEPRALEALKQDWDALYGRAAQPYFSQSFAWCWTSWQTVGKPRGRRLHCMVARQQSRAVLIWPFVVHRLGPWSVARPLGPETTEYTCVLVEDGPAASTRIENAWKTLRATCSADIIALPLVRSGSALQRLLSSDTTPAFVEIDPTSYVSLNHYPDWDSYFQSLDAHMRKGLRRRRRRLEEIGSLVFEPMVPPGESPAAIDWVLRQKCERLGETRLHNPWMLTPEYRNFLVAMAVKPESAGRLFVSTLRLNNQIIAAEIYRRDKFRIEGLIPVFDPAFAAYGPSQILKEESLRWAFAQGCDYDLRLGKEPHKAIWVTGACDVVSYEFGGTRWGSTYVFLRNAARWMSRLRYKVPPEWRRKIKAALGRGRATPR